MMEIITFQVITISTYLLALFRQKTSISEGIQYPLIISPV